MNRIQNVPCEYGPIIHSQQLDYPWIFFKLNLSLKNYEVKLPKTILLQSIGIEVVLKIFLKY